jgi:glutamine cyclotransferase
MQTRNICSQKQAFYVHGACTKDGNAGEIKSVKVMKTLFVGLTGLLFAIPFCLSAQVKETYRVVHSYLHDSNAFTQGLVIVDGQMFESTGLNGRSSLRRDNLETGQVLQEKDIPQQFFGEGLTDWGNTLVQLTWKAHTAFVYDRTTFHLVRTFNYPWEGWGLTQDGRDLILSDGSSTLHFLDPTTYKDVRDLKVTAGGKPVDQLNELEYIHGQIYANIWMSTKIARISPQTGKVVAWIELAGILPQVEMGNENAVLNGIAYDKVHDRLYVTGKLWPKLFEIKVVPAVSGKK